MEKELVIEISNGTITGIYSTDDCKVTIVNWDEVTTLRKKNEVLDFIEGIKSELKDVTV